MRTLAVVIALVALVALMVFTNPSMDDFSDYVRQYVVEETRKDTAEPLGRFLGSVMGSIAGGLVASQTIRTNYLLFSTYELQIGRERLKALGILGNFVLLEKPDLKERKTENDRRETQRRG